MSLTTQEVVFYRSELRPIKAQARIWSTENQEASQPTYGAAMIDKAVAQEVLRYQDSYKQVPGSGIIHCPSVDCTFPPLESISVCMHSADITSHLHVSNVTDIAHGSHTLPDGWPTATPSIRATGGLNISISSANLSFEIPSVNGFFYLVPVNRSSAFINDQLSYRMGILDFVLIQGQSVELDWLQDPSQVPGYMVTAIEVLVYACVKTYNVSVVNGTNLFESSQSDTDFWQRGKTLQAEPRTGTLVCSRSNTDDPICRDRRNNLTTSHLLDQDVPLDILSKTSGAHYSIAGVTLRFIAKSLCRYLAGWGFKSYGEIIGHNSNQDEEDTFASMRLASIFEPSSDMNSNPYQNISAPMSFFQNITQSLNGLWVSPFSPFQRTLSADKPSKHH